MTQELVEITKEITSEPEIKEIPIDQPIRDFYNHLSYNERIVFSAKFGDGKTYFLNKFFEEHKDEFEAIRIFPVNYQIADNKDVFELIKKDILIHLLANDLIEDEDFFDESIYAQNYLFNNGTDIVLDILSDVPAVKVPAKIIQKSLKHLKKYKDERSECKTSKSELIEKYLLTFENDAGVAEYDSISELISRIVKSIQEKERKVILVIDDLDRIDPAHLFRILNVLTAHIDREVVLQKEIENGVGNNKFNFDHIITVFDFQNTQKIFHHLYGTDTDFLGYISKFVSSSRFMFSLNQVANNYLKNLWMKEYQLNKNIFEIPQVRDAINKASVRDKLKLCDNIKDEIIDDVITQRFYTVSTKNSFTYMIVILKKLNISIETASNFIKKLRVPSILDILDVCVLIGNELSVSKEELRIKGDHGASEMNIPINILLEDKVAKRVVYESDVNGISKDVLNREIFQKYQELKVFVKP